MLKRKPSFFIFSYIWIIKLNKSTALMETYQEKISLLQEMIAFALVDGELHDREYDFIEMISLELEIDKETFHKLFENRSEVKVIKDEFNRICQFYRLALLMHADGVLHEREQIKINEIGINMGLNPYAMKRVLHMMKKSPNRMIDGQTLLSVFAEQHN
ncbi:TerB family tellurite resistance protein [Flavobacterium sp. NRK F7]|uniref:TerB family tellurite resistance protein n=1 Tax=Flavobacterium sp. NRK F7 TaxID=2954930 RepID=UPI0027E2FDA3|nr:TerB family tellurite resistance protein [Flavobacterium sp. NRK F7]